MRFKKAKSKALFRRPEFFLWIGEHTDAVVSGIPPDTFENEPFDRESI